MHTETSDATFDFPTAFTRMLEGRNVSRKQFGGNGNLIYCRVQKPDGGSMNTLPYIQMVKPSGDGSPSTVFPVTLSPESMFANDWYVVGNN